MDEDEVLSSSEPEHLLYDWFKHLTSLSLLTLGGVLSISQAGQSGVERSELVFVLLLVAAAGIMAFHGAEKLVGALVGRKPMPRQVQWMQRASPIALTLGVGMFIGIFMNVLD